MSDERDPGRSGPNGNATGTNERVTTPTATPTDTPTDTPVASRSPTASQYRPRRVVRQPAASRPLTTSRFSPSRLSVGTSGGLAVLVILTLSTLFDRVNYNDIPLRAGLIAVACLVTLLVCLRRHRVAAPMTLAVGLATGIDFRLRTDPFQGSDTLLVTRAGIDVMASGGNPYSQFYESAIPPSTYFPYLIGEPTFYWIHLKLFGDIYHADLVSGVLIMLLFAALVPIVGWFRSSAAVTLYAISSQALMTSAGGSNDNSMMLLITAAIVLLIYSEARRTPARWRLPLLILAALFMGWALAFKIFALVFFPFVLLALRQRGGPWLVFGGIAVGLVTAAMAPYAIDDFGGVLSSLSLAGVPRDVWGFNVWTLLGTQAPDLVTTMEPWIGRIQFSVTAILGIWLLLRRRKDLGSAILAGLAVCFSLVFLAKWTSSAYYGGFLTILILGFMTWQAPALKLGPARLARVPTSLLPWPLSGLFRPKAIGGPAPHSDVGTGFRPIIVHARQRTRSTPDTVRERIGRFRGDGSEIMPALTPGFGPTEAVPRAQESVSLVDLPRLARGWPATIAVGIQAGLARLASRPIPVIGVLAAMVVGGALRLANLSTNPPGINQDEAVAGYDALSLWLTMRDHHGNPLPWVGLETFGDWASPLLSFYLAPIVGTFGLEITVIRIGTALLGIAAIPLVFLAARELTGRTSTAIVAAWLLAISPWAVHLSRYAIPPATVIPLFALTLWLMLRALRVRTPASLVLAVIGASLLISGYPTMKLYVPLMVGAFLLVYLRDWLNFPLRGLVLGVATFLLLVGPTYLFTLRSPAVQSRSRYLSLSNWTDVTPVTLAQQYWSYISPTFIFERGDGDATHIQPGFGLEFRWLAIFMAVGILFTIGRAIRPDLSMTPRRPAILLLLAVVLSPIPGAITYFQNSSRVAQLDVLFAILTAIGIIGLFDLCRSLLRAPRPVWTFRLASIGLVVLILVPLGVQARNRYHDYFVDYPETYAVQWGFHSGLEDALRFVRTIEDDYAEIFVTDVSQGYMLVLFVNQVDPNLTVFDLRPGIYDGGTFRVEELGPYQVTDGRSGPPPEYDVNSLPVLYESFMYDDGFGYVVRATTNAAGQPILIIQSMTR